MDKVAAYVPPGLGLVRLGNFHEFRTAWQTHGNELGSYLSFRPFGITRHPSQLYQAFGEGIVLFIYLLWMSKKKQSV